MKKFIATAISLCLGISAFAFDGSAFLAPAAGVKSYIKTDYLVSSKFGEYFRTPNVKYQHVFNNFGQEVENTELTVDGKIVDKIVYEYDAALFHRLDMMILNMHFGKLLTFTTKMV